MHKKALTLTLTWLSQVRIMAASIRICNSSHNVFDKYLFNYVILNNYIYDAYAPYLIQ